MTFLVDTNVAIHLRDQDEHVIVRLSEFDSYPALSILSLVELEAGVHRQAETAVARRTSLDSMVKRFTIISLDRQIVSAYGHIVAVIGFSRPRILDRLIAATAIVRDLTLITVNRDDFTDIPSLKLEVWPAQ